MIQYGNMTFFKDFVQAYRIIILPHGDRMCFFINVSIKRNELLVSLFLKIGNFESNFILITEFFYGNVWN